MWVLRILTGVQSGLIVTLDQGKNLIGRAANCKVKLRSQGISKNHAEIQLYDNKVVLIDLKSSNGTYVNGFKINNCIIYSGDKISFHDVIADLVFIEKNKNKKSQIHHQRSSINNNSSARNQSVVLNQQQMAYQNNNLSGLPIANSNMVLPNNSSSAPVHSSYNDNLYVQNQNNLSDVHSQNNSKKTFSEYFEKVAMAGVYKLVETSELKIVLTGFILLFVFLMTALSVVPMIRITKNSIEKESRRRALSIARNLYSLNKIPLAEDNDTNLSTKEAEVEEGVISALIISHKDGSILAPINKIGEYLDKPFIHTVRRENKEIIKQIDAATIGVSVPIPVYDQRQGLMITKAHAVVLYDMGSLAIDKERILSLFIQTLALCFLLGGILLFFLYKLFHHIFSLVNTKLDEALKAGDDSIEVEVKFPILQKLVDNINNLLSRLIHGDVESGNSGGFLNKDLEAENLLNIMGYPALAVNSNGIIISGNSHFANMLNIDLMSIRNQAINQLPDQALQLNIDDLVNNVSRNSNEVASNNLDFNGVYYLLNCQAISSKSDQIDYFVITFIPNVEQEGGY